MSLRTVSHGDLQNMSLSKLPASDNSMFKSHSVSSNLSDEIHMERIMMRTESELTMRNLRNLNRELQAEVKELKQKLHLNQQRVSLCSRAVAEADKSRSEAEKNRTLAEARALESKEGKDAALADKVQLSEELQNLSKEHKNMQLLLAQTEKNYFEAMLKLERVSGEKEFLLKESKGQEDERNTLRWKIKELTDENATVREKEATWRRKAAVAEEKSERVVKEQQQAEHESRLAKREKDKAVSECLSWQEKHQDLADMFREQEDLRSQRQNKACQANIKSYFLCMTESDQRIKILKNCDGTPRKFAEGDPVYISSAQTSDEDSEKSSERTILRVAAPTAGRHTGPVQFSELSPVGADPYDSSTLRRNRKVVDYFWIPTEQE